VINKQGDAIDLTGLFQPGFLRFICFIKHLTLGMQGKTDTEINLVLVFPNTYFEPGQHGKIHFVSGDMKSQPA